jgi:hypothetical protein
MVPPDERKTPLVAGPSDPYLAGQVDREETNVMERDSSKHAPEFDEQLAREAEGPVRSGGTTHAKG